MEQGIFIPKANPNITAKWVNVVEVEYIIDGMKRKTYFHPASDRLNRFKKNMASKILAVTNTRIPKNQCWVN